MDGSEIRSLPEGLHSSFHLTLIVGIQLTGRAFYQGNVQPGEPGDSVAQGNG
ncbi:hypothetical protein SDC9_176699 [bioreactor metagenome]|uniref:Uncharacterized protein n=1 Tax=bioreactor metagenome TaxID=1076179 RepID=A0A645GQS7_9ZZZZ